MVTNGQSVKKIMTPDGEGELVYVIPEWDVEALAHNIRPKTMGGGVARVKFDDGSGRVSMGWYAAEDCSIVLPPSGHLYFEDGVIKIVDTLQVRYNVTREWAAALLEDGTVLFEARLAEKESDEVRRSTFRLTIGTIAALSDFLPMVFSHFQINYYSEVSKMNEVYQRDFPEHYKESLSLQKGVAVGNNGEKLPDANALLCAAFSKVKFPAHYDHMSKKIIDAEGNVLFQIGGQVLGENAGDVQDAFGEEICRIFNSSYGKNKP